MRLKDQSEPINKLETRNGWKSKHNLRLPIFLIEKHNEKQHEKGHRAAGGPGRHTNPTEQASPRFPKSQAEWLEETVGPLEPIKKRPRASPLRPRKENFPRASPWRPRASHLGENRHRPRRTAARRHRKRKRTIASRKGGVGIGDGLIGERFIGGLPRPLG